MKSESQVYLAKRKCGELAVKLRRMLFVIHRNPTREQALEIIKRPEIVRMMLLLAAAAREYAQSHRDFDVGSLFIALRDIKRPGENPWVIRHSANTRESTEVFKYCGELRLDDLADELNVCHYIALCVVGQPNLDHGSGKQSETLTPCEICRYRFRVKITYRGYMQPNTVVVTANHYDLEHPEYWTVASIHEFHGEDVFDISVEVKAELRC